MHLSQSYTYHALPPRANRVTCKNYVLFVKRALSSLVMELVRTFLESSSIHGLSYIASTRKVARIGWFLIIFVSFSCAANFIFASLQSWSKNPVTTRVGPNYSNYSTIRIVRTEQWYSVFVFGPFSKPEQYSNYSNSQGRIVEQFALNCPFFLFTFNERI